MGADIRFQMTGGLTNAKLSMELHVSELTVLYYHTRPVKLEVKRDSKLDKKFLMKFI